MTFIILKVQLDQTTATAAPGIRIRIREPFKCDDGGDSEGEMEEHVDDGYVHKNDVTFTTGCHRRRFQQVNEKLRVSK